MYGAQGHDRLMPDDDALEARAPLTDSEAVGPYNEHISSFTAYIDRLSTDVRDVST